MSHGPSKQVYSDGAIYHNNPIQIADKERKLIWPDLEKEYPDIVVSIGTTFGPFKSPADEKISSPRLGVFSHGKSLYKIAIDHMHAALDSEKAWLTYMSVLQPVSSQRYRYIRLNPQLEEDPPRMDEVNRMLYFQNIVRGRLSSDDRIQRVAHQLIASSFYFEKTQAVEAVDDGSVNCKGLAFKTSPSLLYANDRYQDVFYAGYLRIAPKSVSLESS